MTGAPEFTSDGARKSLAFCRSAPWTFHLTFHFRPPAGVIDSLSMTRSAQPAELADCTLLCVLR